VITGIIELIGLAAPRIAAALHRDWLISICAFILTIASLYLLALLSNVMLGRRVLGFIDDQLERIPLVHTVYGGVKKVVALMRHKPAGTQRVVLIGFPSPEMKSVGFVTRVFIDESGREIAAVYVPTTPNPTGGYLELVPTDELIATDWTVDQGMAFLISGGALAPDSLPAVSPVGTGIRRAHTGPVPVGKTDTGA
ncbi:MAG TPA: DUF502 domain-containing protein, partial [Rhodanobacteraceae bacterium]|nr:DUF502 domain-containing protein [Rhodanobacteraceae bacterium]